MKKSNNMIDIKDVTYWKTLEEKQNHPSVINNKQKEFFSEIVDDSETADKSGLSRRKFLALSAASTAMIATACTNYHDKGEIVSYNKKPQDALPGLANYYASTCTACSLSCGILIKTRSGRPVKIDGNSMHPVNKGKICSVGQASLMNLYSPERIKFPVRKKKGESLPLNKPNVKWEEIDKVIISKLLNASNSGKQIAVISRPVKSPTQKKVIDGFIAKYPAAKFYSYELYSDELKKDAWEIVYGNRNLPVINLNNTDLIVTFESDILGNEGNFVENIRQFTEKRNVSNPGSFNRLYAIEGKMSLTGMNADYRLRLNPIAQFDFLMAVLNEIANVRSFSKIKLNSQFASTLANYKLADIVSRNNMNADYATFLIDDLIQNAGKGIVLAGNSQSIGVQIAVLLLNELLGNTLVYEKADTNVTFSELSKPADIESLISSMNSGMVDVVIHLDTNPVFDLPVGYGFTQALRKVPNVICLTEFNNETAANSDFVLPVHHDYESWGDFKTRTGTYSLQQPVINPLYKTRQKEAVLLTWASGDSSAYKETIYHEYLKFNWQQNIYPEIKPASDFTTFWFASLHDGVVIYKENTTQQNFGSVSDKAYSYLQGKKADKFTMILSNNYSIGADGRYANNGWLQELPHPITKITWDNYAMLSPNTAKKLGVEFQDKVSIKNADGQSLILPVVLQPGLAEDLAVVELGYGRTNSGELGNNVGVNINKWIKKSYDVSPFILDGCTIEKVPGRYIMASTQEHHMLDDLRLKDIHKKRHIIQEGTLKQFNNNPNFLKESKHESNLSMYPTFEYKDIKWAMAIDLNKCVGCAMCVSACNVENNIPVVGKDQTIRGREMHWIRIDRYYSGTSEEPEVSNQPMLCQHCDSAPCENVCPVVATNHSPDGLNQMVYNRCVGTRYCSNNCPFKVRRFNFYDYRDNLSDSYQKKDSLELMHNPEVTVRARGVMEKCTFCVQRIMEARQDATKEGRPIKGTDVKTACQQACPAEAIVFGDMNDRTSEVAELREHKLGYHVLEELNIKPNVTYIAKLRNKNSEDK